MEQPTNVPPSEPSFSLPSEPPDRGNSVGWIIVAVVLAIFVGLNQSLSLMGEQLPSEVIRANSSLETAIFMGRSAPKQYADTAKEQVKQLLRVKGEGRNHALRVATTLQWEYGFGEPARTVGMLEPRPEDEQERRLNRLWKAIYGDRRFLPGDIQAAPELLGELGYPTVADLVQIHLYERIGENAKASRLRAEMSKSFWTLLPFVAVLLGIMALAMIGCVLIVRFLAAERMRPPVPFPMPWSLSAGDSMARVFLFHLFVGLLFVLPVGTLVGTGGVENLGTVMAFEAAGTLMALIVSLWFFAFMGSRFAFSFADIGLVLRLNRDGLTATFLAVCAAFGALVVGALITFSILPESLQETNPLAELALDGGFWETVLVFARGVILAPVAEEIFFRGVLFMGLWRRLGSFWWAAVLSSVAFAAIHPTLLSSLLSLTGVGIVFCVLLRETKSLVPCILAHAAYNLFLLISTVFLGLV